MANQVKSVERDNAVKAIATAANATEAKALLLAALALCHTGDDEYDHSAADTAIISYFAVIGEGAISEAFDNVGRWFA